VDNKVLSLDLKTVRESLIKTVCGSEFQTDGAENRKARLEKSVLVNGWTSSGMADERKVRLQTRSVIRSFSNRNFTFFPHPAAGPSMHQDRQGSLAWESPVLIFTSIMGRC